MDGFFGGLAGAVEGDFAENAGGGDAIADEPTVAAAREGRPIAP
jgi:hypothetical protein